MGLNKVTVVVVFMSFVSCTLHDANFVTIDVRGEGDLITVDNNYTTIENIRFVIAEKQMSYDSIQKDSFFVKLIVDDNTTTGTISDLKHELRKAGVVKLKYYLEEEGKIAQGF